MKCEESGDVGESTEEGNGEKEEGVLGIAGCVFLLHSLDEVVLLCREVSALGALP